MSGKFKKFQNYKQIIVIGSVPNCKIGQPKINADKSTSMWSQIKRYRRGCELIKCEIITIYPL